MDRRTQTVVHDGLQYIFDLKKLPNTSETVSLYVLDESRNLKQIRNIIEVHPSKEEPGFITTFHVQGNSILVIHNKFKADENPDLVTLTLPTRE